MNISLVDILKDCKIVVKRLGTFVNPRKTPTLMPANEQQKGLEFNGTQQMFMKIVYVIQLEVRGV